MTPNNSKARTSTPGDVAASWRSVSSNLAVVLHTAWVMERRADQLAAAGIVGADVVRLLRRRARSLRRLVARIDRDFLALCQSLAPEPVVCRRTAGALASLREGTSLLH